MDKKPFQLDVRFICLSCTMVFSDPEKAKEQAFTHAKNYRHKVKGLYAMYYEFDGRNK